MDEKIWKTEPERQKIPERYLVVGKNTAKYTLISKDDNIMKGGGIMNNQKIVLNHNQNSKGYVNCFMTEFRSGPFQQKQSNEVCIQEKDNLCYEVRISTLYGYRFSTVCSENARPYKDMNCVKFIVKNNYGTHTQKVCRHTLFTYGKTDTKKCMIGSYDSSAEKCMMESYDYLYKSSNIVCWMQTSSKTSNIYCGVFE